MSRPRPTPVSAMWPMPSPSRASRRCTMNVPTAGAATPTSTAAISARRRKSYDRSSIMTAGRGSSAGACGCTWSWPGRAHSPCGTRRHALVHDPAGVQDDRAGDQRLQRPQLVGDEHDRTALADQVAERGGERLLAAGVDAGRRLVHDEGVGLAGEGARDQHALLLAAGQLLRGVAGAVGHADRPQRAVHGRAVGGRGRAEPRLPRDPARGDDLAYGRRHPAADRQALRDVPDALPVAEPRRRHAVQLGPAGRQRAPARAARGPAWTCRSRWRPSRRRPRRARPSGRRRAARGRRSSRTSPPVRENGMFIEHPNAPVAESPGRGA